MDLITLLWFAIMIMLATFIFIVYHFFFAPKSAIPGQYINPKINRRPVSLIQTPDLHGFVRALVDEEDQGSKQPKCSIFVENAGQTHIIKNVDIDKDVACYNSKQAIAGADSPIWVCSRDRNGIRHPGYLKYVTGNDENENIRISDLQSEVERLMREFARLKQQMQTMSTDEGIQDRIQDLTDSFSRLRSTMLRFPGEDMYNGPENEEPGSKGGRR